MLENDHLKFLQMSQALGKKAIAESRPDDIIMAAKRISAITRVEQLRKEIFAQEGVEDLPLETELPQPGSEKGSSTPLLPDISLLLDSEGLFEIPRPHTETIQLTLGGEQLLIDESVGLAYGVDYEWQRKRLFITRHKTIPVTVMKEDGSERTFAFFDPEKIREPFVKVRIKFAPSRPLGYIGRDYQLIFSRFLGDKEAIEIRLNSPCRVEINPFGARTDPSLLLEELNRAPGNRF